MHFRIFLAHGALVEHHLVWKLRKISFPSYVAPSSAPDTSFPLHGFQPLEGRKKRLATVKVIGVHPLLKPSRSPSVHFGYS